MAIQVRIPASLRDMTDGMAVLELPGNTVGDVLHALVDQYPSLAGRLLDEQSNPLGYINLFVGSQDIRDLSGLETPLTDGTEILIVSAVAGG